MKDGRVQELAKKLVTFSCEVQPNENVLIETYGAACDDLLIALIEEVYAAGA